MALSQQIKKMLAAFQTETPAVQNALARLFLSGSTGDSGQLLLLSGTHGINHNPALTGSVNPRMYDPAAQLDLAVKTRSSAYMAPLGQMTETAPAMVGSLPGILWLSGGAALASDKLGPIRPMSASVRDAVRLGCVGVGLTILPGSDRAEEMFEDMRVTIAEAREAGLFTLVTIAPKGGFLSRTGETALDVLASAVHAACAAGAHIVAAPVPEDHIEQPALKRVYRDGIDSGSLTQRITHLSQAALGGKRPLLLCPPPAVSERASLFTLAESVRMGGAQGIIFSADLMARPQDEAIGLAAQTSRILTGRE